jgi:hypothetical protein
LHSSNSPSLKAQRPIWTIALLYRIWLDTYCLVMIWDSLAFISKSLDS